MASYEMSPEEKEYLSQYDITRFDRPSIAADIAVFSIMGKRNQTEKELVQDTKNYRKLPEKKLKILLIKRATYPYRHCWALPGGFCQSEEDVYETARRELYEETHVKNVYLNLSGIYGEVGRDPRGWIISHTFLALMDGDQCCLKADTDAWEARWFDVDFEIKQRKKQIQESSAVIENEYYLSLKSTDIGATNLDAIGPVREEGAVSMTDAKEDRGGLLAAESDFGEDRGNLSAAELDSGEDRSRLAADGERAVDEVVLSAVIREKREFKNYHETVHYEIIENDGFAFDHAKTITCAILSLRQETESDGKIVFDLMSELFTFTELQKAFEIILDRKLLVANFRRKMMPYVIETDQILEGAGHRPAKLFRRNVEMFYH